MAYIQCIMHNLWITGPNSCIICPYVYKNIVDKISQNSHKYNKNKDKKKRLHANAVLHTEFLIVLHFNLAPQPKRKKMYVAIFACLFFFCRNWNKKEKKSVTIFVAWSNFVQYFHFTIYNFIRLIMWITI